MKITKDIKYVGVNDHEIDLFEGQYIVENGMAYNSYAVIGDKIAIMEKGVLVQYDTPMNIYRNPANEFVREFLNLDELVWTENGQLMKYIKK